MRRPVISRLKLAVMLPFAVFVTILAVSVSTFEYQKFKRESARISIEINTAIDTGFRAAVDTEAAMLRAVAETVVEDDALAEALRAGDRARLERMTERLFAKLHAAADITHLYFLDAGRRVVLRAHQPDRHGDLIERRTALAAERTRAPAHGLELGPLGTLTLRAVVPWVVDGRLVGYVETGKEIDELFADLRRQFSLQPLVFLPKSQLDRDGWEKGMAMLGREARWDEFPDDVLVIREGVPEKVLAQFMAGESDDSIHIDERYYTWLRVTLPDMDGERAATVGVVMDGTARHQEMVWLGKTIVGIALAGSMAVVAFFWLVIDRVEAELTRTRDELAQRELLYHSLFSGARVAMLLIDPEDGAIVDANDEACRFYGHEPARLKTMRIAEIDAPSPDTAAVANQVQFRHRLAGGEIRDVEVHAGPVEVGGRHLLFAIVVDIADRKRIEEQRRRAEERLKESERRFRSLIEGTTDWTWETDENHRFSTFSPSFETVVNIPPQTLLGRRRWDLASESHEIDPTRWQSHMEDLAAQRSFRDFRYWIHTGAGKAKWISISGTPRFDDDGRFLGYLGSGSDVTVFADISLRLRTMSKVVEQSPVSVVITDTDGAITYVNPHFTTVTGYAFDEVVGKSSSILASGETSAELYRNLWSVIAAGGTWAGELRNRRKDGGHHWEQVVIFPVTNDEGRLVHFVAIKEDVTARKEADARLREQVRLTTLAEQEAREALVEAERARRHTGLLLSSAGEGIFGIDARGVVTFANPAALAMLGVQAEGEMIGRRSHDFTGHLLADGTPCTRGACSVIQTLADGMARRADSDMFQRRGAGAFPVEFSVTAMTEQGAITGAVVVFHDITERRAAERALTEAHAKMEEQAKALARSNAELEQFAYVASHDLRQPLRMVSSYLTLIERAIGDQLTDDVKTFFDFATDGAKRMDRLILDLLDYSRTGRNAAPDEVIDLDQAAADGIKNLEVAIADAGATVTVAAGLPSMVGDRTDLTRLFQNLIGNAVKYRAPDRAPVVEVGCRPEGDEWLVWVRDNGIGIAPADRERAFQIFQRLVPRTAYEGTGIGLAVCKKIVEHHGGRIWIESELGQGSCFWLAFPRQSGGGRSA